MNINGSASHVPNAEWQTRWRRWIIEFTGHWRMTPAPGPLSSVPPDPSAARCGTCLRSLLLVRLGALAGQGFAYGWATQVFGLRLPITALAAMGAGLLVYTLAILWRQQAVAESTRGSLLVEAIIDLVALTGSLYLTGGSANPLVTLLLLPVTVVAATQQPRLIWVVTGIAIACYTTLMFFHLDFPVPHHGPSGFEIHIQGMWYGFLLSVILIAYFVAHIGAALRARDQELAQAREKALVERSPMGIFLIQDGRLNFVNPRLADLLEARRDDLIGVEFLSLVQVEDRSRVARALPGSAHPAASAEIECRLTTGSGQARWVAIHNTPIISQGAAVTLGNVQDLTERKRMEDALRQLSARLLNVQEEERRRVARDLHDGLCQTLTAARLVLERCLGDEPQQERRAPMAALRALVPAMRGAVDEVRRISTALRPAMLDDLGLLATVRWYLAETKKLYPDLEVRQHLGATEEEIPECLKTPLFRILQEAVHNAAKHSRGSALDVCLTVEDGLLRLAVQDNGVGFAPGGPSPVVEPGGHFGLSGLGMSSMRERTKLSRGVFRLVTMPGSGTTVEARWRLTDLAEVQA